MKRGFRRFLVLHTGKKHKYSNRNYKYVFDKVIEAKQGAVQTLDWKRCGVFNCFHGES